MIKFDSAPGYPDLRPIIDWTGSREHRGRKYPVSGCGCVPCRIAIMALLDSARS